jgi:hypothetical protein
MALPIEPTPVLEGEAAEELLAELEAVCSQEEAKRRIAAARALLDQVGLNNDDRTTPLLARHPT